MKNKIIPCSIICLFLLTGTFCMADARTNRSSNLNSPQEEQKVEIIYLVDGVEVTAREVDKLDPAGIEHMEFIKTPEKIRKYTDKAEVTTVVLIKLKQNGSGTTDASDSSAKH